MHHRSHKSRSKSVPSAGSLNGLVISQASSANTNPLDAGIRINNADDSDIGAYSVFPPLCS